MKIRRWHLLAILFLCLGIGNLLRAWVALTLLPTLSRWNLSVPIGYLVGLYGLWGGLMVGQAVLIFNQRSGRGALWVALFYQGMLWGLRFTAYRSVYAVQMWPRDLLVSLVFLGVVAVLMPRAEANA